MSRTVRQPICDLQFAICNLQSPPSSPPNLQPRTSNPARSAFTLVELLMVIAIIGMLVALVSVAAVRAIGTARNTQILTEIGLLDSAMQTYKNDTAGSYPPDCSLLSKPANNTPGAQDVQNRQNRIIAHFRKAFPRLIISGGYGSSSSLTPGTLQYMSINMFSKSTLYGSGAPTPVFSGPAPNGVSQWGDFDNMDQAEALVFWLGGFAIPYVDGSGKVTFKLVGFGANKVGNASSAGPTATGPNSGFGPFNLDVQARDVGKFEFQQGRLGDADGDGWPEYYPPVGPVAQPPTSTYAVSNPMPPYVYFDAVSYGFYTTGTTVYPMSAVYPSPLATKAANVASGSPGAQPSGTVNPSVMEWGTATPYVATLPTSGNMTWVNPQKFQIICAGLDQQYYFFPQTLSTPVKLINNALLTYPGGLKYSQGDLDNLTNFSTSVLRNAQP